MKLINNIRYFLYNFIFGISENEITNRIYKLKKDCQQSKKQLQYNRVSNIDISWFRLNVVFNNKKNEIFKSLELKEIPTLTNILKSRISREEAIKLELNRIDHSFNQIKSYISKDLPKEAEVLLYQIFPCVNAVSSDKIYKEYHSLNNEIQQLKSRLFLAEQKHKIEVARLKREEQKLTSDLYQFALEFQKQEENAKKTKLIEIYENKLSLDEKTFIEEIIPLKKRITQAKPNCEDFIQYLGTNRVEYFYHFTDIKNIPSIRKYGGLFSWHFCTTHGISIANPGGNDQSRYNDKKFGLEDYVRLSFCKNHPMSYSERFNNSSLVLLKIKIDVAGFVGTLFSNINATDSKHKHGSKLEDLQRVNISITKLDYVSNDTWEFKERQAECMVKTFVPLEYIVNINNPEPM